MKPENLLCSSNFDQDMHIFVADFVSLSPPGFFDSIKSNVKPNVYQGLSRLFDEETYMTTYCGSPEYVGESSYSGLRFNLN